MLDLLAGTIHSGLAFTQQLIVEIVSIPLSNMGKESRMGEAFT